MAFEGVRVGSAAGLPTRMAVFGDVGGQLHPFAHQLRRIGADLDSMSIPPDVVVVQIGDLVSMSGRGDHENDAVVELAMRLQEANPKNYIQMWGNHDLAAVGGARRASWSGRTTRKLRDRLTDSSFVAAVGIVSRNGSPLLLTHAGVTVGAWQALGFPELRGLVQALNMPSINQRLASQRPGRLVTNITDIGSDEQWAEVNFELYGPWLDNEHGMPWIQVHGHASPWSWRANDWWPDSPSRIRSGTLLDHSARISRTGRSACQFMSVNWELTDRDSPEAVHPLVIHLAPEDEIIVA